MAGDRTRFPEELPGPVVGEVGPAPVAAPLIMIRQPTGERGYVTPEELPGAVERGATVIGQAEQDAIIEDVQLERDYGDRPVSAAALGLARGATLGLSDVVAEGVFGEGEAVREIGARSPRASFGGELLGMVGPSVLLPGAGGVRGAAGAALRYTPAGQVARRCGRERASAIGRAGHGRARGVRAGVARPVRSGDRSGCRWRASAPGRRRWQGAGDGQEAHR